MTTVSAAIMAYQAEVKITDLLQSLVGKVDQIVVGIDSKTTDHTEEIAQAFGAVTFPFDLDDNFAGAREQTFAKCESDWVLWIDTDDVLAQDIPLQQLCDEQMPDVGMVWLPYVYHRDEYGNATTIFDRERLIRKSMFTRWRGRLHETCETSGKMSRDERVWVEHKNRTEGRQGRAELPHPPEDGRFGPERPPGRPLHGAPALRSPAMAPSLSVV